MSLCVNCHYLKCQKYGSMKIYTCPFKNKKDKTVFFPQFEGRWCKHFRHKEKWK